jgi:nicotinamidase-related amidase
MIDCQNTYTRGVMELDGVQAALDQAEELLSNARSAGIPIFHVMHDAGPGTPYDVNDEIGQVVSRVAPREGEPVLVENYPNSFTETCLHELPQAAPGRPLVLAGFMTHMCRGTSATGRQERPSSHSWILVLPRTCSARTLGH